jgi:hypothetical protein
MQGIVDIDQSVVGARYKIRMKVYQDKVFNSVATSQGLKSVDFDDKGKEVTVLDLIKQRGGIETDIRNLENFFNQYNIASITKSATAFFSSMTTLSAFG